MLVMSPQKQMYDKEFREKILSQIIDSDKSTSEIANEIGVSPALLRQWKHRYIKSKDSGDESVSKEEYEKLRDELENLRVEKEILLKTLKKLTK